MNCAFDKEKLSGYYDGELDAAEKAEVERHIASCSECLRELGELKSAAILVKELPRLRAPRSIAEGVQKEIQAAGRVHSFAKVRRTVMWAASAAAVLFIGINVIYFTSNSPRPAASEVAKTLSPAPVLGRATPPPAEEPARRQVEEEQKQGSRRDEARKNEADSLERKLAATAPAKPEPESRERERAFAPKPEPKPAPVPAEPAAPPAPVVAAPNKPAAAPPPAPPPAAVPAPAPAAPPVTAAARPTKEESKAPDVPADKAPAMKKDGEGVAKQKAAEAVPAADAGPTHLTLASTQMTKSRPDMTEALKKMGHTLPPPPSAAMVKGVARSGAREETVYVFDLTDAQIARLRAEFEKPGTSTLVAGRPEDPVMAQFKRGGVFEAKKEVASGGAGGPGVKKFGDSKADAPKEAEDAAAASKVLAEGAQEKTGEPRRRVVIHFLEVPYIPDRQPAADAIKK